MSAIDASRLRDIKKAMDDNADYAESDSEIKAARFVTALRRYIVAIPAMASRGSQGEEMRYDLETLKAMLADAEKFLFRKRTRAHAGFRLRGTTRMPLRSDP